VLGLIAAMIGGFIVVITIAVIYIYQHTPVPTASMAAATAAQSIVYADDGKTVIGRLGDTDRQVLNYNQIPSKVIASVLAAEDRNFFNEGGVSPTGILRAAFDDVTGSGGSLQGGSTITQEFVRQYYAGIGTQQTASRKIKEIFVALKISRSESKQWILQNYLNTIYLGESSYGIAAAAQTYFDLPVSKLQNITWSQAALLAAVIQQPSTYPLSQYHADFEARWQYVIQGLVKTGYLSQQTASTLTFPKFGDYIPQTYGKAVWDPYVLNVVQNELEGVDGLKQSEIYNNGYKIVTTIDPAKMNALYQSVQAEETDMSDYGESFQKYMHVGAVLESPSTGAIEAMYGGPGFPGYRYNGVGPVITAKLCKQIYCTDNMAIYNREQVGSSFKPYSLSTAVAQGMDVQTSKLDGLDDACIPPDTDKSAFPVYDKGFPINNCQAEWYPMGNDSYAENGVYTPQDAMTNSINTAYADLWHYVGGPAVVQMAANYGVNTAAAGISGPNSMENEAGVALGQGSLTVAEQANMLATIDNDGTWHQIHIVKSISQGGSNYATKLQPQRYVLDPNNSVTNQNMDSQVQYGMEDVVLAGTGTAAEISPARPIISKTGTTNTAQSGFFIGAIPQEALAVAIFTNQQGEGSQTLNGLGGISQGDGGTWPAMIWHTYAQQMFTPLPVQPFLTPDFTGQPWILAPSSMLKATKKPKPKKHPTTGVTAPPVNTPSAYPTPTQTCPPGVNNVDCVVPSSTPPANGIDQTPTPIASNTGIGGIGGTGDTAPDTAHGPGASAGAAVAGSAVALPLALFWVRKRSRRGRRRG
jgi:membrane peptidoglycan carboxypeptidase